MSETDSLIKVGNPFILDDEEDIEENDTAIKFYGFFAFASTFIIAFSMYLVYITYSHPK